MASKFAKTINQEIKNSTGKNAAITDEDIFESGIRPIKEQGEGNQLPQNEAGQAFEPWGKMFSSNPKIFGDYMNNIAVKYGVVFFKLWSAKNPLATFKRGLMPYGGKAESQIFDMLKPKYFRPDLIEGEDNPYARAFGRIVADTYTYYENLESNVTIQDTNDTMFYQNLESFNDFVYGRLTSIVNGMIMQEFFDTKNVLSTGIANGYIQVDQAKDTKDVAKKLLYWGKTLQYFDNNANVYNVMQATKVDDLVVIIPKKTSINLDVDYFSNVFNEELVEERSMERIEIDHLPNVYQFTKDHVTTADDITNGFIDVRQYPIGSIVPAGGLTKPNEAGDLPDDAIQTLDGNKVGAVVIDRDALQLWDSLPLTLSALNNPRKRYVNLFANKKTMMMLIQALNMVAIMLPDKKGCEDEPNLMKMNRIKDAAKTTKKSKVTSKKTTTKAKK